MASLVSSENSDSHLQDYIGETYSDRANMLSSNRRSFPAADEATEQVQMTEAELRNSPPGRGFADDMVTSVTSATPPLRGHPGGNKTSVINTVGATSGVSQQTRHARRVYIGNIPPSFADEELLKDFLNSVISRGLGEENVNSYIISLYVNEKKCFAFVEFNSVELTTACLELDGLLYHASALRVLRANEYKPELVPSSSGPPVTLRLPASAFGTPPPSAGSSSVQLGPPPSPPHSTSSDQCLDYTFIQLCPIGAVRRDSVALIGFPYDESSRRATGRLGCSAGPKAIRNAIRKPGGAGSLVNPEFGIDLRSVLVVDVGDIPPGLPFHEACARLASAVMELVHRGAVPVVLGGSPDQSYWVATGLMAVTGGAIGAINVSSQLDVRSPLTPDAQNHSGGGSYRQLLEDARFCPPSRGNSLAQSSHSCEKRLVIFGAQGSLCSMDHANFVTDHGGSILWLSTDLRRAFGRDGSGSASPSVVGSPTSQARRHSTSCDAFLVSSDGPPVLTQRFKSALYSLSESGRYGTARPIVMTINAGAMCRAACPGNQRTPESSLGLSADEILDMTLIAGANSNIVAVDLCGIVPEIEEDRSARLFADILYRFIAGVASRHTASNTPPVSTSMPLPLPMEPPVTDAARRRQQGSSVSVSIPTSAVTQQTAYASTAAAYPATAATWQHSSHHTLPPLPQRQHQPLPLPLPPAPGPIARAQSDGGSLSLGDRGALYGYSPRGNRALAPQPASAIMGQAFQPSLTSVAANESTPYRDGRGASPYGGVSGSQLNYPPPSQSSQRHSPFDSTSYSLLQHPQQHQLQQQPQQPPQPPQPQQFLLSGQQGLSQSTTRLQGDFDGPQPISRQQQPLSLSLSCQSQESFVGGAYPDSRTRLASLSGRSFSASPPLSRSSVCAETALSPSQQQQRTAQQAIDVSGFSGDLMDALITQSARQQQQQWQWQQLKQQKNLVGTAAEGADKGYSQPPFEASSYLQKQSLTGDDVGSLFRMASSPPGLSLSLSRQPPPPPLQPMAVDFMLDGDRSASRYAFMNGSSSSSSAVADPGSSSASSSSRSIPVPVSSVAQAADSLSSDAASDSYRSNPRPPSI